MMYVSPQTNANTPISTLARMYQIRRSAREVAETFGIDKYNISNWYNVVRKQEISKFSFKQIYEKAFGIDFNYIDKTKIDPVTFYKLNFSVRAAMDLCSLSKHVIYSFFVVYKLNKVQKFTVREVYNKVYGVPLINFNEGLSAKDMLIGLKLKTVEPLAMTSDLCSMRNQPKPEHPLTKHLDCNLEPINA